MTVDQGRALLMLIRRDISQSERQNAAFGMLRVILQRKLVFADLYDFMDELSTLLLQTFDDSLRNHCARVLLNFLLNYPMADKRVDSTLTFLLKNIEYEEPSGRLALLHLLLQRTVRLADHHGLFLLLFARAEIRRLLPDHLFAGAVRVSGGLSARADPAAAAV